MLSVQDDPLTFELARHLLDSTARSAMAINICTKTCAECRLPYFSQHSGVGLALTALHSEGPVRMGVVGLGVGVLSGYVRKGDYARFYEINPKVVDIADSHFTFLPQARQAGDVDVLLGDARLTLERQPPQEFDLLAIDAFSSDAIPTHPLTREAFQCYKHHGPMVCWPAHISNRYIDLAIAGVCKISPVRESIRPSRPQSQRRHLRPSILSHKHSESDCWRGLSSQPEHVQATAPQSFQDGRINTAAPGP